MDWNAGLDELLGRATSTVKAGLKGTAIDRASVSTGTAEIRSITSELTSKSLLSVSGGIRRVPTFAALGIGFGSSNQNDEQPFVNLFRDKKPLKNGVGAVSPSFSGSKSHRPKRKFSGRRLTGSWEDEDAMERSPPTAAASASASSVGVILPPELDVHAVGGNGASRKRRRRSSSRSASLSRSPALHSVTRSHPYSVPAQGHPQPQRQTRPRHVELDSVPNRLPAQSLSLPSSLAAFADTTAPAAVRGTAAQIELIPALGLDSSMLPQQERRTDAAATSQSTAPSAPAVAATAALQRHRRSRSTASRSSAASSGTTGSSSYTSASSIPSSPSSSTSTSSSSSSSLASQVRAKALAPQPAAAPAPSRLDAASHTTPDSKRESEDDDSASVGSSSSDDTSGTWRPDTSAAALTTAPNLAFSMAPAPAPAAATEAVATAVPQADSHASLPAALATAVRVAVRAEFAVLKAELRTDMIAWLRDAQGIP